MVVVPAQFISYFPSGCWGGMNHTLFEQNGQQMTERSTQSTMVSPDRLWAIAARQVFIEKLLDLVRVKLFGRQATLCHPSGKVG
jgi:hypothetical protein